VFEITYDSTPPTVVVTSEVTITNQSDPIDITFTYNEDVKGFAIGDILVSNCTKANFVKVDPQTYTVEITPDGALAGTEALLTVEVPADKARDFADNYNLASNQLVIQYDDERPVLAITGDSPTNLSPFELTIDFGEDVTEFVLGDILVTGDYSALNLAPFDSSDQVYVLSITPNSDDIFTVDINANVAYDLAGNGNKPYGAPFSVEYDSTAPTVEITGPDTRTNMNPFNVTVDFSEDMDVFVPADIVVTNGVVSQFTDNANTTYTVEITPSDPGLVTVRVPAGVAIDEAGNPNVASNIKEIIVDPGVLWVTINQAAGQDDPTSASPILFEVQFEDPVQGFTGADISFAGSTKPGDLSATVIPQDNEAEYEDLYMVEITGMTGDGTVVVSIPANIAKDEFSNYNVASTSADNQVDYMMGNPTVTINQTAGQADPTNTAPIEFTVVFSEEVTGFTGTDIDFTGSTTPGVLSATVTGDSPGAEYTVEVSGMSGDFLVVASIPAGAAQDEFANDNEASTSSDNEVTFDDVAPAVLLSTTAGEPTSLSPIPVTITFSEPVTGFTIADIGVTNGTLGNFVAVSESVYTVEVTPTADGDVTVAIAAGVCEDLAGNLNTAAVDLVREFILGNPYVVSIVRLDPDPTNAAQVRFLVTFSEIVTGVSAADFALTASTNLLGTAITGLEGTGPDRIVTLSTGTGYGTLRLDVPASATILDSEDNAMTDLPYEGDESYHVRIQTFTDVPVTSMYWQWIERLYAAGITAGCTSTAYCPDNPVSRAQMAIFLERGMRGSAYTPPSAMGTVFSDVPATAFAAAWIEQLYDDGITAGCGFRVYCPNNPVTRAQ
ncbi:MAG: Ig-like domain-containing protein, partial [Anaerolineales bacterium]